jgi:hypothetical protein
VLRNKPEEEKKNEDRPILTEKQFQYLHKARLCNFYLLEFDMDIQLTEADLMETIKITDDVRELHETFSGLFSLKQCHDALK